MKESYIYIVSNKNRTLLYIGVTSNLIERIENHKKGNGSSFTKKYNVSDLLYYEVFTDIKEAILREKQLKKWNKEWKWDLIKLMNPNLLDLYEDLKL
ncbi:GIY-YIG nuclease family protein [Lutibacter sp. HS1-25]|uniref:GIY-YIG nuclease family protein n=1 Tax=Lutibacter sp. HS1-25 TaxID=2485000 RepID=UPI001012BDC0|nr:GIY-YIG nuclease family protein [Lutibacter sp. HS1-25]RXP44847.1 GIY-YIG nuclease family protein [Lutibacter sp. HS1-25]